MEATVVNKKYPLWLWLTSMGVAAVIMGVVQNNGDGEFSFLVVFTACALAFSSPVFLICFFSYRLLVKKLYPAILIKILMALISIAGLVITILILGMDFDVIVLIYSGAIILSSIFFKVYKKEIISN